MAVNVYDPLSRADTYRRRPIDEHGKIRSVYTKFVVASVAAGDIGSTFNIGKLPPGAVRLIYPYCWFLPSAWAAARTINVGYAAYRSKQDVATIGDGIEAGSANGLASALDMSAAVRIAWSATLLKYDFYSLAGVDVIATLAGGTVPVGGTLEALMTYLYE